MSANNRRSTVYLILIALLLCTTGYFAWQTFQKTSENTEQQAENEKLDALYLSTVDDLKMQELELNKLKGQNADLDSLILLREQEISTIKAELEKARKNGNWYASQLKDAKGFIEKLKADNANFIAQVDSMKATIGVLEEEKATLTEDLTAEKKYTSELEENKEYLEGKFELGSLLQANNLTASGIKGKKNGAEKEVAKVKATEEIKVCYNTGQNLARNPGNVTMYLRIETPSGETIYNEQLGSGTFELANGGGNVRYTKLATFDYDNSDKPVCIYTSYGFNESGTYMVYMYQDGYELGSTSVTLK